jgi:hypothetical protein
MRELEPARKYNGVCISTKARVKLYASFPDLFLLGGLGVLAVQIGSQ